MSEENIENVDVQVDEKNIPVFIETDGHVIQVGFASEVNESGGRSIEKFSAFKKVVLVNPIFGDGEGEIQIPIESHIDPEEEGLTVDGHPIDPEAATTPAPENYAGDNTLYETHDGDNNPIQNGAPVEAGTDSELNAEPVAADPDGSTLLENDAPAEEDEEAEFERQLAEEQARETVKDDDAS